MNSIDRYKYEYVPRRPVQIPDVFGTVIIVFCLIAWGAVAVAVLRALLGGE